MKIRKIFKWIGIAAAALLVCAGLLMGWFTYVTEYRITEIDSSRCPDGRYELRYQAVGEPDFPFGAAHARLVLKDGTRTVSKLRFDVADDGAVLWKGSWSIIWEDDCARVTVCGSEQPDAHYTLYFDGRTERFEPDE